jgi:hypothetical protein
MKITADRSTSSTSFADVVDAVVALEANTHYEIFGKINVRPGTGGLLLQYTLPSGATSRIYHTGNSSSVTAFAQRISTDGSSTTTGLTSFTQSVALSEITVTGWILTTNAGTIQMQFALASALNPVQINKLGTLIKFEKQ